MSDKHRPLGVTLIGILYILVAIGAAGLSIAVLTESLLPAIDKGLPFFDIFVPGIAFLGMLGIGVMAIYAGVGLLQLKDSARWQAMLLSVFMLFLIPIGTVLGIVFIWYLLKEDVEDSFNR